MYVSRPLSLCRNDPTHLSTPPIPYSSGYIVVTDEESEADDTCCWGICKTKIKELPFPQNKILKVVYTSGHGEHRRTHIDKVWFIPVLDQPMSSNRYYVIKATGKYKGKACTCSREEDMATCCFCNCINDVHPRALDHRDMYQQVEVFRRRRGYTANSVVPDGFPPLFLRRKGWTICVSDSYDCQLGEALGLNVPLRMRLPELNGLTSNRSSTAVVVGKWYCPFVFIKEGTMEDQMMNSVYYEMTLEQRWEEIYTCDSYSTPGNIVSVTASVQKESASLSGEEYLKDDTSRVDGFVWFRKIKNNNEGLTLGLSSEIVGKMRLIQEKGGWIGGPERDVMINKGEEFKGGYGWNRFGCFVLVERFCLRRLDGTSLLNCDYRHVHQLQSIWE